MQAFSSKEAIMRWSEYINRLSTDQKMNLFKKLPDDAITNYVTAVDEIVDTRIKNSRLIRTTKWVQPLVDFTDMCKPLADGLGAMYPLAGAILGGVFFALSITRRITTYQETLIQFLNKIMSSLEQLGKFRSAFPDSPEIQTALVDIFGIVVQICVRTLDVFIDKTGKDKSSVKLLTRSFKKDFGEWKEMLAANVDTFDRTVQLVFGKKLGYLQEAQSMALISQLDTYNFLRESDTERNQEARDHQSRQKRRDEGRNHRDCPYTSPADQNHIHQKREGSKFCLGFLPCRSRQVIATYSILPWTTQENGSFLMRRMSSGNNKSRGVSYRSMASPAAANHI